MLNKINNTICYNNLVKYNKPANISFAATRESESKDTLNINSRPKFLAITPTEAIKMEFNESLEKLQTLIGEKRLEALLNNGKIESPVAHKKDSKWIESSNIIGINPRILGNYWNVVKYAMTFPEDAIHLLPLFEPGCADSLYSPASWKLNKEFMSPELSKLGFNTPEKQVKFMINALHSLGKTVGMDVIQQTDRFAEDVFANPGFFEWVKLNETKTKQLNYPEVEYDKISKEVEKEIISYLKENGDADGNKLDKDKIENFFSTETSPEERNTILFGDKPNGDRRLALMNKVREAGFEPIPLAVYAPYRPMTFDKISTDGNADWADFTSPNKEQSKQFGSLTPYKLYHINNDNSTNLEKPNKAAWKYIEKKQLDIQKQFNFDFARFDMGYISYGDSHDEKYNDLQSFIKNSIQQKNNVPYFASIGEVFTSDVAHNNIEKKNYEAILGDLQYQELSEGFIDKVKASNLFGKPFKIMFTTLTADSDRKKKNYLLDDLSKQVKMFMSYFLNQPSYMNMGLETRNIDIKDEREYSKYYITTHRGLGPFKWGNNDKFFNQLTKMRNVYVDIKDKIKDQSHFWLSNSAREVGSWIYFDKETKTPSYLFVANADKNYTKDDAIIDNPFEQIESNKLDNSNKFALKGIFSTDKSKEALQSKIYYKGDKIRVTNLVPGECRIYKIVS